MSNQNAINLSPSTANYVELTNQFNNLRTKCSGRMMSESEQITLNKVADTYGVLFGVSRREALDQLEQS